MQPSEFGTAALYKKLKGGKGLLRAQLNHFYNSLILFGMEKSSKPDNWLDAFLPLERFLQKIIGILNK